MRPIGEPMNVLLIIKVGNVLENHFAVNADDLALRVDFVHCQLCAVIGVT